MLKFTVLKQSKQSGARLGLLETSHGVIETPAFVPVATRGSVRFMTNDEIVKSGAQLLITNTFHLHLTPGEERIAKSGGLHEFMHWDKPLMTDSGGFQVFSMGFGTDHGVGKILQEDTAKTLEKGTQPSHIKITDDGVHFKSPRDGSPLYLDAETSIGIQEKIGADIMFAFDECPSPLADREYMTHSLTRTHAWAKRSLNARRGNYALYGIIQGGAFTDLREESARVVGTMDFDGFGIGGEFGYEKSDMETMLRRVNVILPHEKPRHLLGVGHPEDFEYIVRGGADTFDCIAPTHYARHGTAFTSVGRVNLKNAALRADETSLDPNCSCPVCINHTRAYISHLYRSDEPTALVLATMHNLYYLNALAAKLRDDIKNDRI